VSLSAPIGAGLLLGSLAAFAVYSSAAPLDGDAGAVPTPVPTVSPVQRPTVTVMAPGCESPAVLVEGECVVISPGPTVGVPGWGSQGAEESRDDDHGGDDHDDEDHDDDDRRDRSHEDHHDEDHHDEDDD
jgi:hypothetical protein